MITAGNFLCYLFQQLCTVTKMKTLHPKRTSDTEYVSMSWRLHTDMWNILLVWLSKCLEKVMKTRRGMILHPGNVLLFCNGNRCSSWFRPRHYGTLGYPLETACANGNIGMKMKRTNINTKSVWCIDLSYNEFDLRIQPHGPLARYVKLRVAHAPRMPGAFSPPPNSKENR